MRATATPSPIRNGKRRLLSSCAVAAGIMALSYGGPAQAQVAGAPLNLPGTVTLSTDTVGHSTSVGVSDAQTIINWVPTDTATSTDDINFLPAGSTWNFNGNGDYVVLNRFVNGAGGSLSRQIALNGTINSTNSAASGAQGGSIWFYNAGGILIGSTGVINVGSLVLTTNDIVTTGGLFDTTTGAIRFRGTAGSVAGVTVNGEIHANQSLTPGSSYVALVAPRVAQNGLVDVYGSAAYVAAESADIRINAGLFDIDVLTGTTGGQALTHTGITTGPEQQATGPAQRIYMVAIPKNLAVTMLVSGQVGYQDSATAARTDSAGRIILSAGYDVTNGDLDFAPNTTGTGSADITVNDTIFRSDVTAHASGAFVGRPLQDIPPPAPPTTFIPPNQAGTLVVQGNATFIGDANATLTIDTGHIGGIGGNLTVQAGGTATTPGNAAINVDGGGLLVQGFTSITAPAFYGTASGDTQGGDASLTITNGGQVVATGGLAVSADAFGGIDGTGQASGDGTGGSAAISVTGADSSLTGGTVYVHANGYGAFPSSGLDNADTGGAGTGGSATISVQNGAVLSITDGLTAEANGQGGFGLIQSGGGTGGSALIEATGTGTTLQAGATTITATGAGGGDFSFDPVTSSPIPSLNGGDGRGGSATLRVNTDATATINIGATNLNASATGGAAGGDFIPSGENATGGDAQGGDATIEILGGTAQMSSLTVSAAARSGDAYSGSGLTGRTGDAQGGTIALSATGAGSVLTLTGGVVTLDAAGVATSDNRENAGSGSGGQIAISATGGGTIRDISFLSANAFGGSDNISSLVSAGSGDGGSIDFLADTGGTILAQVYRASARGSVVNTDFGNGAAQGGSVTMIARGGGSITATADGTTSIDVDAINGVSADGSAATGGDIQLIADGGTIALLGATLSANGLSGSDGAGSASLATGGTILVRTGADPASLISVDSLDAEASGTAGANSDGFFDTPGDSIGGTITVDVQGGRLASSGTSTGLTFSANGNGGTGGNGRGGTVTFTQTGGEVDASNVSLGAEGVGGAAPNNGFGTGATDLPGLGTGGTATLTVTNGTFAAGDVTVSADGFGALGGFADDFSSDHGDRGGNGSGGDARITIGGTADVSATQVIASAAGRGGDGGYLANYGNIPGGSGGDGGTGIGGNATVDLTAGTLSTDSVVANASGFGGQGGDVFSATSGASVGASVGGAGGAGTGGTATLNLGETQLDLAEGLFSQSRGTGGNGGYGATGGNGGTGRGNIAQAIVDNFDAGQLGLQIDSSATGGTGGSSNITGGNGGDAFGGIARAQANGANAAAIISQGNFRTNATGGNGGAVSTDFFATPAVAGRGGDGGSGTGGTLEVVAMDGATIGLSGDFSSTGTGGNGGNGGDNPNTVTLPGPDGIVDTADDVTQGLVGGDGGIGGGATGGTVHLFANGGTISSDGAPVAITVGAVSGVGGNGGTGSGSNGNFGGTLADQGGRVLVESLTTSGGTGQISLGDTSIQANGSLAGRIELRADSSITMNSLTAEATGFAEPVNGNTNATSPGIFLAVPGGSITTTGDMTLRTNGGVGIDAQADGQVNAGGNLAIDAFDTVYVTHSNPGGATNPTLSAVGNMSISSGLNINAGSGTLLSAGGTLTLQGIGPVSQVIADRLAGNDIVITANDLAVIEHAEAVNDFSANAASFRTGLNSIITGGDIDITAVGTVDLGNSTAGGGVFVVGQSIAFNAIDAGTFVTLRAQGLGATDGIFGTDITATSGANLDGRSVGIDGTIQSGGSLFVNANAGNAAVGLADVAGDIVVFAGTDLSGTYRGGGNVTLGAGGNVTAEADAAGGYVGPSANFASEGYVLVDADGDVSLTNSSAATMLGVHADGAASLTGASAGEDVFVLAGTTATLSGITAGDDLTVQADGAIGVTNAATTGTGRDDRSVAYIAGSSSPNPFLQIVTTPADQSNVMLTAGTGIAAANVDAFNNLTATAVGAITATGPLVAGDNLVVDTVGAIDLADATAGGFIDVNGQSIGFDALDAGTFVSLSAQGLGATDGVFGTDITAGNGVNLSGQSVGVDGTVQSGGSLFVTANTGNAAVGLANIAGDIVVFAGTDLSGTYRAGGNVTLRANGNVAVEADAAGGYVDPSGAFTSEGYVLVDGAGDVSLTNSSAATMLGVRAGGAASLTGASAGEDVFVLAGTTATLSGITAGDDLTVQADGAVGVTNAATTGTGRDDRSIIYAPGASSPTSFLQFTPTPADLSNITLTAGAGITAANVDAFNNLTATAVGAITATGPLIAGDNLVVGAVGAINLADATAGGFIDVNGQSIGFDALDAGGYVDLDTTASAANPGAITGASIDAGADVYMAGSSIDIGSITSAASLSATGTTGAVAIDNAIITGNIGVSAAGNITGTYSGGGDAFLNSGGNVIASVSAAGGYPDSSNPDVPSGGNVYIDAVGNVTLTDSSAAGMFGVNGRSVALTNAAAGEDMLVLAQGTATLADITVGDDLDVRATGAITADNVSATGLGPDGFLLNYSPTGGFTIGQGEGSTSLDGADIDLNSSGGSIGASALSAGDDIFLTAATAIALDGGTTLGLGITGGDSSIRTSGGDTTVSGLDAFSDVIVASTGAANVTGPVQAGRHIAIDAASVQLADLTTPGGNVLQTLTADGDITITSAAGIDGGSMLGQGNVSLSADGAIDVTGVASGGDMTLSGATGIAADGVQSGGTTILASSDGLINLASLVSVGSIDASGDSLFIGDGGDLTFANLTTDAGDAAVRTRGELFVVNGSVAGVADLTGSGERVGVDTLTADRAVITATNGFVTLNNVSVTDALNVNARSSLLIDGVVTGANISLTSGDIEIGSAARVGTADQTQSLSIANGDDQRQTFIGGTGARDGYHIDADELSRVFGHDVGIFAQQVSAITPALVGGATPPDVVVDSFTMTGGAAGSNLGVDGSLTIRTPGKMRVLGDVRLTGLSDANALNLRADRALEVILGQGSVRLLGANDAPGGQLNLRSDDVIVATPGAIDDVANATTLDAIETRLAQNDGIILDEGALFARGIGFIGNAYVQNSGSGTDYAQRRGLTFGAGGLNVATEGNARIVINGVHLDPNGQVTGLDAIPLLTVNDGAVTVPSDLYDPRSTFNGCLIANTGACSVSTVIFDTFPVQDVIEEEVDSDGENGDGTSLPTALITMRDVDPLSGAPLLDDPVTGAGNDDLWTPTTDTQQP
ncbi:hypothetical protein CVO77_17495 [Sphingopyxis lindanitolerans]|uniref:Filamentous haemagglutinin FhaB/tRNA nuclease CdiA-like TPS domain-containing protein n=1 Tax=Sphingopyxis lindanitolerans TaxID=2054227 RepID=A0A2S8B304_9SPHN|nr:hypothetical protein [Sphingopyxis lindanitolerans]PQM26784.1 hypothetical protein CVO77_17495 [Sphingopyxis lindanitolerans]